MNTKNNKRHQETIRRLETAFLTQLQQKSISQIKVSEICQLAQINRSTFYANYCDVYDLADSIHKRMKDEVIRIIQQDFAPAFSENHFLRLFQHIQANQEMYSFYFRLGFDRDTETLFLDHFSLIPYSQQEELLEYHVIFFKNGFNSILKRWLEKGCTESPEQMRDVLLREYQGRLEHPGECKQKLPMP